MPDAVKSRLLAWCDRHCCWCGKACGQKIEIHHIDGDHSNHDEENLCPVCFDDHAELNSYNVKHPRGLKYRPEEIRRRRDQVYEEHTRKHLPEGVYLHVTNFLHHALMIYGQRTRRDPGDVSCTAINLDPVRACRIRVLLVPYSKGVRVEENVGAPYLGAALWTLSAGQGSFGHFGLDIAKATDGIDIRVDMLWSIVDELDREHRMPPKSWVWNAPNEDWWFDPVELPRARREAAERLWAAGVAKWRSEQSGEQGDAASGRDVSGRRTAGRRRKKPASGPRTSRTGARRR